MCSIAFAPLYATLRVVKYDQMCITVHGRSWLTLPAIWSFASQHSLIAFRIVHITILTVFSSHSFKTSQIFFPSISQRIKIRVKNQLNATEICGKLIIVVYCCIYQYEIKKETGKTSKIIGNYKNSIEKVVEKTQYCQVSS